MICSILSNNVYIPQTISASIPVLCFLELMLIPDMVGWRTSSIRREKDLVKVAVLAQLILGNLHVALNEWHLNRSYCSSICSPPIVHWMAISTLWMLSTVRPYHQRDPIFLPRLPGLKKLHNKLQTQKIPRNTTKWWRVSMNFALHTYVRCAEVSRFLDELWTLILETEEMTHGLQKVGWKKVDVNFHSSFWPYLAHNNIHVWAAQFFCECFLLEWYFLSSFIQIPFSLQTNNIQIHAVMQVKNEWLHNAGAGVIAHVADSIKQQESRPCLPANL